MSTFTAIKNKAQGGGAMGRALDYVEQEKKTLWEERQLVTGWNCVARSAYPEIEVQERLVDAMAAKLADPEFTRGCEVFVLPNLYGDIVTDAAAELQGGLGSASSSNIGNKYALFEAIHGTAPYLISHGRGNYANPCSLIRAAGQLMAHIGFGDREKKLERALDICCNQEKRLVVTTDTDGATAEEFTSYLLETLTTL